jgi:hypothetical protein
MKVLAHLPAETVGVPPHECVLVARLPWDDEAGDAGDLLVDARLVVGVVMPRLPSFPSFSSSSSTCLELHAALGKVRLEALKHVVPRGAELAGAAQEPALAFRAAVVLVVGLAGERVRPIVDALPTHVAHAAGATAAAAAGATVVATAVATAVTPAVRPGRWLVGPPSIAPAAATTAATIAADARVTAASTAAAAASTVVAGREVGERTPSAALLFPEVRRPVAHGVRAAEAQHSSAAVLQEQHRGGSNFGNSVLSP